MSVDSDGKIRTALRILTNANAINLHFLTNFETTEVTNAREINRCTAVCRLLGWYSFSKGVQFHFRRCQHSALPV